MDGQVGQILKTLEEVGQKDRTLVLFSSEQGSQFPGCKWTNWDTGVHTAMIARWPGKVAIGKRTDAIVQYADVLPTLLDLAGGKPVESGCDGTSFLPLLQGKSETHRQYAYFVHNNLPEGPPYPIRAITDGRYRYIRNLLPDEVYIEKHLMGSQGNGSLNNPYWATWVFNSWDKPEIYRLVKRYTRRPAEQLYLTADDPYEMTNLIGDPKHAEIGAKLSVELDRWLKSQGDPGAAQDTPKVYQAAQRGEHMYYPPEED